MSSDEDPACDKADSLETTPDRRELGSGTQLANSRAAPVEARNQQGGAVELLDVLVAT